MRLYDISRPITPATSVWPGDQPYRVVPALQLAAGHSVNLMTLTLSPHTGAHADAPLHFEADGPSAADLPLDAYLGPARVVSVGRADGALTPDDLPQGALKGATRLLIHSPASLTPFDRWPQAFPYLSLALIEAAAAHGLRLIGLDSPSVDAFTSTDLPCHHALWAHGILHLESLMLDGVPDGDYELIALPLRLEGACASPVRAVLRALPTGK
jgi:arylformamidase